MNKEPETYEELIRQKRCIDLTRHYNLTEEDLEKIYEFLKNEDFIKLNELHELYSGALATSPNAMTLENEIANGRNIEEVERIDILIPATKDWKSYQQKSIKSSLDKYNRKFH